jgi:hypothetical protein
MKYAIILFFALSCFANSKTLFIGQHYDYSSLQEAAPLAEPGDTLLLVDGLLKTDNYISYLQGTEDKPIYIIGATGDNTFDRGAVAFQISNAKYLIFSGIWFMRQTQNGVNIDDGGDYSTPSSNIIFDNCHWSAMDATGNNDMLKMSGVDDFVIRNCSFTGGAQGGSQIDMVGCHHGLIEHCHFDGGGSNCIQAKGGSSQLAYRRNIFVDGGQRALNIGGSTGLQFFRPLGVKYEATQITAYANVFVFGTTPFAFVGATECSFVNNTVILPHKWAFRILQENISEGMLPCGKNVVANNIFSLESTSATYAVNIGPNVSEEFLYTNNLWYIADIPTWPGPNIPWNETTSILNEDPLITDNYDPGIGENSPVIGRGMYFDWIDLDYNRTTYLNPPSIGAVEAGTGTSVAENLIPKHFSIYPNPANDRLFLQSKDETIGKLNIEIFDLRGSSVAVYDQLASDDIIELNISDLNSGMYYILIRTGAKTDFSVFVVE